MATFRLAAGTAVTSWPPMRTDPCRGASRGPAAIRSVVLLPDPEGRARPAARPPGREVDPPQDFDLAERLRDAGELERHYVARANIGAVTAVSFRAASSGVTPW